MKYGLKYWLFLSAAVLVSCADSKGTECGSGDPVDIDGNTYCVFEQAVVVENGFECPPDAPFLTQAMGFGVCGKSDQIPIDLLDDIHDQWQLDRGSCTVNSDCAPGKNCVAGVCQTGPTNNNNSTNNATKNSTNNSTNNLTNNSTNNSTNNPTCATDDNCAVGQSCVNGACKIPCGGIAGGSCGDTEWCDYGGVSGMCGAADQLGVCEPRPDVCDAAVTPVCGCDSVGYNNACEAQVAGVDIISEGACP